MSSSTSSTCILIEVRNRKKGEMEAMEWWGQKNMGFAVNWENRVDGRGGIRERGAKSRDYSR